MVLFCKIIKIKSEIANDQYLFYLLRNLDSYTKIRMYYVNYF